MNNKIDLAKGLYTDSSFPVLFFDRAIERILWYNPTACALVEDQHLINLSQICIMPKTEIILDRLSSGKGCQITGNPLVGIGSIMLTPVFSKAEIDFIIVTVIVSDAVDSSKLQDVISAVSAQYREPMFAIQNMLGPLRKKLEQYECFEDYLLLKEISNNCYKTMRSTLNIANYFRYMDINVEMKMQPVHINQYVADLCVGASQIIRRTDISFEYEICEDTIISRIDSEKLSVAILNLIANACLYSNPDNVVTIKLMKVQNDFMITVSDKGIGIATHLQQKIFEPFFSYDVDGSPACGVGLGLPIVKRVSELHGGTCVLTSEADKGTTVAIRLPVFDELAGKVIESPSANYILSKFSLLFLYLADICHINTVDIL